MNGGCRRAWWWWIQARVRSRAYSSEAKQHAPTESLRRMVWEIEKKRRRRKKGEAVYVTVPESMKYLDTATMPMTLTFVGIAVAAKLLWDYEYSDTKMQERIERRIKEAPEGQGTVRMLTREEWLAVREIRPRTPFESKFSRPNARIRSGEPVHMEDVKDWSIDVITDALTRVEESVRSNSS